MVSPPRRRNSRDRHKRRSRSRSRERKRYDDRRSRSRSRDRSRRHRSRSPRYRSRSPRHRSYENVRTHDRERERDRDREKSKDRKLQTSKQQTNYTAPVTITDNGDITDMSQEDREMMKMMGFCSFDTTKGKKVENNDVGAVHVILKRKYRQYMNRKGGFNRPLDFVA